VWEGAALPKIAALTIGETGFPHPPARKSGSPAPGSVILSPGPTAGHRGCPGTKRRSACYRRALEAFLADSMANRRVKPSGTTGTVRLITDPVPWGCNPAQDQGISA